MPANSINRGFVLVAGRFCCWVSSPNKDAFGPGLGQLFWELISRPMHTRLSDWTMDLEGAAVLLCIVLQGLEGHLRKQGRFEDFHERSVGNLLLQFAPVRDHWRHAGDVDTESGPWEQRLPPKENLYLRSPRIHLKTKKNRGNRWRADSFYQNLMNQLLD